MCALFSLMTKSLPSISTSSPSLSPREEQELVGGIVVISLSKVLLPTLSNRKQDTPHGKSPKVARRPLSRYAEGHLLCREENTDRPSQDGQGNTLEDLRAAFQKHQRETEGQVQRLEKVFQLIEEPAKGKKCAAIEGIIEEGQEIMAEYKGSPGRSRRPFGSAQAVEHYEISRYGTLKAWAEKLELPLAVKLLDQTLTEEKNTDGELTELAEAAVNQEAEARRRRELNCLAATYPWGGNNRKKW